MREEVQRIILYKKAFNGDRTEHSLPLLTHREVYLRKGS
jgi:hypothetical protein